MRHLIRSYRRNYFRMMAFLMRAFVVASLAMFAVVAVAQLLSGDAFTSNWALTYAVALPVLGIIWFASKKVQQMGPRSK